MSSASRLSCVALVCLASCGWLDPTEWGSDSKHRGVDFRYRDCAGKCSLDRPVLAGTRETIDVTGRGDQEGVTAVSSDATIADFVVERACSCLPQDTAKAEVVIASSEKCESGYQKRCENELQAHALRSGDVTLKLQDETGAELGHASVQVRNAAAATFFAVRENEDETQRSELWWLEMAVGEKVGLEVELRDGRGRMLHAARGVGWQLRDSSLAVLSPPNAADEPVTDVGLHVEAEGMAPGKTELKLQVAGIEPKLTVIVDP